MKKPQSLTTRLVVLALLLAFGPLKATAAFACEMMETVVHEVCCCDEAPAPRGTAGSEQDCDDEMTSTVPCCEHSATVGVDADVLKAHSPGKSGTKASAPFDIDPPDAGLVDTRAGALLPAPWRKPGMPAFEPSRACDGSTLWLTTRRLRI